MFTLDFTDRWPIITVCLGCRNFLRLSYLPSRTKIDSKWLLYPFAVDLYESHDTQSQTQLALRSVIASVTLLCLLAVIQSLTCPVDMDLFNLLNKPPYRKPLLKEHTFFENAVQIVSPRRRQRLWKRMPVGYILEFAKRHPCTYICVQPNQV